MISSDPNPTIILGFQDEDSLVNRKIPKRVMYEEVIVLHFDVSRVKILGKDSFREKEDHANATLVIYSMEVEVDTWIEEDIKRHTIVTREHHRYEGIRRNNCIAEASNVGSDS